MVLLSYKINENCKIVDVKILKGLGFGCDEEAKRVVSLLDYKKPKNRGIRISTTKKIRIAFKLPESINIEISYNYIDKSNKKKNKAIV